MFNPASKKVHNFKTAIRASLCATVFLAFSASLLYAAPPASKYAPGETLDPTCAPGDVNCSVEIGSSLWSENGLDIYYNAGNVGVGTDTPSARFTVNDGSLLVVGEHGAGGSTTITGAGTRMFFDVNKSALRAGYVDGSQWDDANVGAYSTAFGTSTIASGEGSTAFGGYSNAEGDYSTSFGSDTYASGDYSTAFGSNSYAFGNYSTAFGDNSYTFADYGTAFGSNAYANGEYSTAFGNNAYADGLNSVAFGNNANADGDYGIAFGYNVTASNPYSVAFGYNSYTGGDYSTAFGNNSYANGESSTAFGFNAYANSDYSTAFGNNAYADGLNSVAFGENTYASGDYSTAYGSNTYAYGDYSTAFGLGVESGAFVSTALGQYNTETSGDTENWVPTDELFVVGNGVDEDNRSNAFTILKNGNTTIGGTLTVTGGNSTNWNTAYGWGNHASAGYLTQSAIDASAEIALILGDETGTGNVVFNTDPVFADSLTLSNGSLLVTGTHGGGNGITVTGAGTRMFFDTNKSAFRAGYATSNEWNEANVGEYSVAFGNDNIASGYMSSAFGFNTFATGNFSVAFGEDATASGAYAFAAGPTASATGDRSFALGSEVTAQSYNSFVIGQRNVPTGTSNSWIETDPLFVIGNGTPMTGLSNALTVLKNGNLGVGVSTPSYKLEVGAPIGIGGTVATFSEGDIFTQHDGDTDSAYPVFARYWDSHETWPSTTFIFGNGTNSAVGIEKPGGTEVTLFRVRATSTTFSGSITQGGATNCIIGADANGELICDPSDENLKRLDAGLGSDAALDIVRSLNPLYYYWKDSERFGSQREIGFFAQDVERVAPELVTDTGEYKSLNYSRITALNVAAIQELDLKLKNFEENGSENLFERMLEWFKEKVLRVKAVETEELCIGEVCFDEEEARELKELIQEGRNNGGDSVNTETDNEANEDEDLIDEEIEQDPEKPEQSEIQTISPNEEGSDQEGVPPASPTEEAETVEEGVGEETADQSDPYIEE